MVIDHPQKSTLLPILRSLTSTFLGNNRLSALTEYYIEKWLSRLAKDGVSVNGPLIREQAHVFCSTIVAKIKIMNPPKSNAFVGWVAGEAGISGGGMTGG